MDSNGDWGSLAEHDDSAMAEVWDRFLRLPDTGQNPALDVFCERKHITIAGLLRVGARLHHENPDVLCFAYPDGIKYRDVITGRKWGFIGSEHRLLKVVRHSAEPSDLVLIAEGETDAARLTESYDADVAVLPLGAKHFPAGYAAQLDSYDRVLVALDDDEAGEAGWSKISEKLPHAQRFTPPANDSHDWCGVEGELPELPSADDAPPRLDILVSARDLLSLEVPERHSWLEQAVLPVGGLAMIHGWAKSFKTFIGLDLMSRMAQGQDWCCFEPSEEACRVAVIQFEIPWAYYRQRVEALRQSAREPLLFDENFFTFSPVARPHLHAGNTAEEDAILRHLTDKDIQIVLLDPIRRAMGALSLNDEDTVRKMLGFFERINNEGITVVATHHDNKAFAKQGGGDPLGMTGSGSWTGDPDTIVSVQLPHGEKLATSTRRNLQFTLRNAPSPGPRGMQMRDDGTPLYSPEPHGFDDEDDESAPPI